MRGVPDTLPLSPWTGVSGASAKLRLGSTVRVSFLDGDPSKPLVDSYEPGVLPIATTIDADPIAGVLHLGPSVPRVELAGGTGGPLVLATPYAGLLAALAAFGASLGGSVPPTPPQVQAAGAALVTALAALPPPATTKTVAA
jgi:hypothetical protein